MRTNIRDLSRSGIHEYGVEVNQVLENSVHKNVVPTYLIRLSWKKVVNDSQNC
jgi:hypothetical protein